MDRGFTILDERGTWYGPAIEAAKRRGYQTHHIQRGYQIELPGLAFLRPHAIPSILDQNHSDYLAMAAKATMVQDFDQVEVYEDKSAQFWRWSEFMPATWRFQRREEAIAFVEGYDGWLVSKADVGASSYNVRILESRGAQLQHVRDIFGKGIPVNHCAGGPGGKNHSSIQRNYVLFQEYVPHDITVRVNVIGRCYATFLRYNAPGTKTAQTGNVDGLTEPHPAAARALEIAKAIKTRWCAFDFLQTPAGDFKLLETSLAWPWPSPGNCMAAKFFGPTERTWAEMWDLMFDEDEAGVWET